MKPNNRIIKVFVGFSIVILSIVVSLIILLFISYVIICAIANTDNFVGWEKMIFAHRDPFYVGNGHPNQLFIPIINPYLVEEFPGDKNWKIVLHNNHENNNDTLEYYSGFGAIDKIAVTNNIFILHNSYINPPHELVNWVVIIPSQKIEIGFKDEEEFLFYIHKYNVQNPKWITPDEAYKQFSDTGCLDWIPDCQK